MKKNILLWLIVLFVFSGMVFSINGCAGIASTVLTASGTTGGSLLCRVLVPVARDKAETRAGYQPLQGARVSVVGLNKYAITDHNGDAVINGVPGGTYNVTVGKDGYETLTYTGVSVNNTASTRVGSSNGVDITTSSDPGILDLSSSSGQVGTPVTITGTNFGASQGTSTVTFNSTEATVTSWSSTSIRCTVPGGATTGNVIVTVDSTASNSVAFTVSEAGEAGSPSITSLTPTSGEVGDSVTIAGENFGSSQGSSTVSFNGTESTSITSWSDTQIVCTVPTGATSGSVFVTVDGTSSNGSTFTVESGGGGSVTPWVKSWGAAGVHEYARAVTRDSSNNVYVTGDVGGQILTIKYDSSGDITWKKKYTGAGTSNIGYGIAVDSSGNVYVTGRFESELILIKYDSDGDVDWAKKWGGASTDIGFGVALDSSGNIYVVGKYYYSVASKNYLALLKFNSDGDLSFAKVWKDKIGTSNVAIDIDGSDNIYIAADTQAFSVWTDILLLKCNTDGDLDMQKTWSSSVEGLGFGNAIAADSSGNVYVVGTSNGAEGNPFAGVLVKFTDGLDNYGGSVAWDVNGTSERFNGVDVDGSGYVYTVGYIDNYTTACYVKYSSAGAVLAESAWGGSRDDNFDAVEVDSSGNMFIAGYTKSAAPGWIGVTKSTPAIVGEVTVRATDWGAAAGASLAPGAGESSIPDGSTGYPSDNYANTVTAVVTP
ncbi:MAG: IPT/TIG domain-containing protein [Armatimonadota bacterium]